MERNNLSFIAPGGLLGTPAQIALASNIRDAFIADALEAEMALQRVRRIIVAAVTLELPLGDASRWIDHRDNLLDMFRDI